MTHPVLMSRTLRGPVIFSSGVRREALASKNSFNGHKIGLFYCRKHNESVRCREDVAGIVPHHRLEGSGFETL